MTTVQYHCVRCGRLIEAGRGERIGPRDVAPRRAPLVVPARFRPRPLGGPATPGLPPQPRALGETSPQRSSFAGRGPRWRRGTGVPAAGPTGSGDPRRTDSLNRYYYEVEFITRVKHVLIIR
jgi:hypothetical protein